MRQISTIFLSFLIFLYSMPAIASPWSLSNYAQAPSDNVSLGLGGQSIGKISPLVQGQKAPFDGVLLDAAAAAKLMVDQQTASQKCEIEIEKEVATEKAKLQLDLENTRAAKEALEKELDVRISLKNEHIEFLEKEAQKNEKKANNGKWWLIGGMAIGIALTIGGAFIIREVQRDIQPIVINTGI